MGVSAKVELCFVSSTAMVELSGIRLGGSLSGTAHFVGDEGSEVSIDEPLASQLRRRFVRIVDVECDRAEDLVRVTVRLPLIPGTQKITLYRNDQTSEVGCLKPDLLA